ncbi:hypothetical protein CsatA_003116 [Cannabis sativa]
MKMTMKKVSQTLHLALLILAIANIMASLEGIKSCDMTSFQPCALEIMGMILSNAPISSSCCEAMIGMVNTTCDTIVPSNWFAQALQFCSSAPIVPPFPPLPPSSHHPSGDCRRGIVHLFPCYRQIEANFHGLGQISSSCCHTIVRVSQACNTTISSSSSFSSSHSYIDRLVKYCKT